MAEENVKPKVYVETTVVSDATALPARDIVLEEMWAIKREIAAEYPTLDAYFQSVLDGQRERERQGVKFVFFPPRRPLTTEARVVV